MWPREEDFKRDQYPPMAYVHVKAGLDGSSNITALAYRNISPSILGQRGVVLGQIGDSQGSEGSNKLPYDIGSRFIEWVSPIPVCFQLRGRPAAGCRATTFYDPNGRTPPAFPGGCSECAPR